MNNAVSRKVRFPFEEHPAEYGGESVWADQISTDVYQIINIPFFAYGVNFGDQVLVKEDSDGVLQVQKVVKRSAHYSLRIFFIDDKSGEENFKRLKEIKGVGIGSEKWNDDLYAINVTPNREYESFIDTLNKYQDEGIWEYELSGEWVGNFDGS